MNMTKHYLTLLVTICLLITSCGDDNPRPNCDLPGVLTKSRCAGPTSTGGQDAEALIVLYLDDNGLTAERTSDGLYYVIRESGGEEKPSADARVTVDYVGYYRNDCSFDGNSGSTFNLSDLIQGWQQGIPLVGRCGTVTLLVPPALAYGQNPSNGILAGEPLLFDINLLDF